MSVRRSTYPTKPYGPHDTPENWRIYWQEVRQWRERVRQEGLTPAERGAEWSANERAREALKRPQWPYNMPKPAWLPTTPAAPAWPFPVKPNEPKGSKK